MSYHDAPERRGESSRRKIPGWLLGALITLGAIVLVVGGLFAGSFFFLRDAVGAFENVDTSMEVMAESFGPIAEFRPEPSGRIPQERIEVFLTSRENVAPARDELEQSLARLSGVEQVGLIRRTMAGVSLLHETADFITQRNESLLDSSMGFGEYYYLYTLAYYSWLNNPAVDGPSFRLVNDDGYVLDNVFEDASVVEVRAHREEQVRTSLNRLLLPMLKSQLADLVPDDDELDVWKQKLQTEIAALEADGYRIPWEDGIPEEIAASLDPYRERIETGYSPMCNALEVGLARR